MVLFDFNIGCQLSWYVIGDYWSIRFTRLTASDGSYLFIDDSNRNAIDYLWKIIIIILRKSRHIIDNGSEMLMFNIRGLNICHREVGVSLYRFVILFDLLDLLMFELISGLLLRWIWLKVSDECRLN